MKRLIAGAASVLLGVGLMVGSAVPAAGEEAVNRTPSYSQGFTPENNKPEAWGEDCYKIDEGGETFALTVPARLLVLKSGRVDDVWVDPLPGLYGTASGKDISHVIVCLATATSSPPATETPTPTPTETTATPTPTEPTPTETKPNDAATPDPTESDGETPVAPERPQAPTRLADTGSPALWLTGALLGLLMVGVGAALLGTPSKH